MLNHRRKGQTVIASSYIDHDTFRAQQLQPKPPTNRKRTTTFLPHNMVYSICSTPTQTYSAKLVVDAIRWSRAVHAVSKREFPPWKICSPFLTQTAVVILVFVAPMFPPLFLSRITKLLVIALFHPCILHAKKAKWNLPPKKCNN